MNHRFFCCRAFPWAIVVAGLSTACIVQPDAYQIDNQDVQAVFLHTSDIHSRLMPYTMELLQTDKQLGLSQANAPFGGITRLAAVVQQERRDHGRVAYIETGDVFQGAPIFNAFVGEPEFRAMTNLGVDVFAIGNHEFDLGTNHLVNQALQFANFPMLAANYQLGNADFPGYIPTGKVARPYAIINMKGLRVGVIGLGYVGGSPSNGGAAKGVVALREKDVVQSYVDFLRPMVDLVVVASHAGYNDDLEFLPRTEGVDIVFGGHLHIALNPPNVVQDCDIAKLTRERNRYSCRGPEAPEKLIQRQSNCETTCQWRDKCAQKTETEKKQCQDQCQTQCQDEAQAACLREEKTLRYPERLAELDQDIQNLQQRGCHPRNVLLVHSGAFLKYIGRLQVTLRQCQRLEPQTVCLLTDAEGRCLKNVRRRCVGDQSGTNDWEVVAHDYQLIPVDKNLPQDPQMLRLMEPYTLKLPQYQMLTQVLGFAPQLIRRFSQSALGDDSSRSISDGSGDSALGNMMTEAMQVRPQVWADFAMSNSLGIRSDMVAGAVDDEQMTNIFPFDNTVTMMYLSGDEVQEMMDFAAQKSASRGCQSQIQVSGITAIFNCGGCPGDGGNPCIRQPYDGEPCAQRVTIGGSGRPCQTDQDCQQNKSGEICTSQHNLALEGETPQGRCWQPISCTRSYRMATNNYVAYGGSGFSSLSRNTTQKNLDLALREVTKDYITNMPACAQIPQTYEEQAAGKTPRLVVSEQHRAQLKELEERALGGDVNGASGGYQAFVQELEQRLAQAKSLPEQRGLGNYLRCLSDWPDLSDKDKRCLGLGCFEVRMCDMFQIKARSQCQALGRIRAALRCFSLPCITAAEDGRIQLIFKD